MSRILSICINEVLLQTRHVLLTKAGYSVISACGCVEALEHGDGAFDLILMGHSIPESDRRFIVSQLRSRNCKAPILGILSGGESAIPEATATTDAKPEELLDAIESLLGKRSPSERN